MNLPPNKIFDFLHEVYTVMDECCKRHKLFKVETIGDAYVICSGLSLDGSISSEVHSKQVNCLQKILDFALDVNEKTALIKNPIDGSPIRIRIGLHAGPLLTGIVGELMPRFCLFGESVVVAARLEANGIVNQIHCSQDFVSNLATEFNADTLSKYSHKDISAVVIDKYIFKKRDPVNLKGIGEVESYLITNTPCNQ